MPAPADDLPTTDTAAIRVRGVGKHVTGPEGEVRILEDVDLTVDEGDSVAIVGASGSGKTTLLGLLAGLDLPSAGSIELAGQRLDTLDEEARAALRAREGRSCSPPAVRPMSMNPLALSDLPSSSGRV